MSSNPSQTQTTMGAHFYRVEPEPIGAGECGCANCQQWTVVYDAPGGGPTAIGTSWQGDAGKETAEDVCDLMNMAFDAGRETRDEH